MKILAIESSCDETAAAVIKNGSAILSNVINSQVEIHAQYGGVVPEVAARSHIEVMIPVIEQALNDASCSWSDIDAIAVTKGPGLIGSLLIGVLTAKTLAATKNKPLIGVNHIYAHGFAAFLTDNSPQFPFLALTVSGGHTTLSLYQENLSREVLGETLDDAAGEAFDKVAKLLGLPYPGGPAIGKVAESGDANAYKFPVAKLGKDSLDFSFSGLKTAVLRQVQEITGFNPGALDAQNSQKTYHLDEQIVADIAASFQKAVVIALVTNTQKAWLRHNPKSLVVGGGVACNTELRSQMHRVLPEAIFVPPVLCTDNAAMIGALAFQMAQNDIYIKPDELTADSSLEVI
ncbi:tRNA (adenosine(37)-N6)-threonylcarbamoyltransferase complex transferase subunit TsaD [Candidatus Saccharibacteria bacterium]|nr:tRNA (adenosine(37)-N6)-threonylcarbamoyltransferase complex transferase subunit TsaD [Candidatus Saccharibacteria bacterium]